MKTPKKVFISYSYKNTAQKKRLEESLAIMIQIGEIELLSDIKALPREKWKKEIKTKLEKSDILLYLVSDASLASENWNKALAGILNKNRNIVIIPIILEDCDFLRHPLAQFQALPTENDNIKPISKWESQADGWQNVAKGIRETLASISDISTQKEPDKHLSTLQEPSKSQIPGQPTAESMFTMGNFFLTLGNYDAAILVYTEALILNPTVETHNNRGIAYDNKGDYDNAIADFNKAIELNPNEAAAYNNRGKAYRNKGDYDNAIANYNTSIKLNPNNTEAYNNRGNVYHNKGDYDNAIANYDKAIELNPNKIEAYSNRGIIYSSKGDYDNAIADHDKAIKLNPNDAKSYSNRGSTYGKKNEFNKAIADFNKAIELNPNEAGVYVNCGIAKTGLQDHKGAKQDFHTALKLAKKNKNKHLITDIQSLINAIFPQEDTIIRSISGFIKWIENLNPTGGKVLYRGLSSKDYSLNSSIARRIINMMEKTGKTDKKLEMSDIWLEAFNLIEGAKKQGYDRDPTRRGEVPKMDFEILALLQHHGATTPLMDFSHSPFVALWFACQENSDNDKNKTDEDENGKIIAVDLNNPYKIPGVIDIRTDLITDKEIKRKIEGESLPKPLNTKDKLWRFNPPGFDARILVQNSEFILGKTELGKNDILSTCIIAKGAKESIRQKLERYGISEDRLFRDFSGYAHINSQESPIKMADEIAAEYNQKGIWNIQNSEFDEAISNFTQAIELKSDYAEAYFNRGNAYGNKDDHDKAITNFSKAIELNPNDAYAYYNRGNAYYDKDDYDNAIADYNKSIELNPNDYEIYFNRGNTYYDKDDYDNAIADYEKVIELNPNYATAYLNRGNVYYDKDDYDNAIADYDKAIELNPNYAKAYFNRGDAYNNKDDYDKAIADYDKSIEINPNSADTYFNRGDAYYDKDDYDNAITDYNKSIELNPNDANTYLNRGNAYDSKDDYDNAIADYDKAIELNPNFTEAYFNRGLTYSNKNDYDKAITEFNKAITLNPNDADAYYRLGNAYGNKGDYEKAITEFDNAIELNPSLAEAYGNRGITYRLKGNYDKAIADLNKAIKLEPDIDEAYFHRSIIYQHKGEHNKAIADINKAIELEQYLDIRDHKKIIHPDNAIEYCIRGLAYAKEDTPDNKAAKKDFQTALKLAKEQGNKPIVAHIQKIATALFATKLITPHQPAAPIPSKIALIDKTKEK